ncbi:hypothetical protein ACNF49_30675 [Actinomadura sp. ATCC 39365]
MNDRMSDAERRAVALLLEQGEAWVAMWRSACSPQRDGWRFASLAELLLSHGRRFTPASRPPAFVAGPPGTCFATASRWADEHEGLLYVEGMVVAQRVPVAFDHAWCVRAEADDQVIDPTLPDGMGVAYLGVALTDGYRCAQQARRGVDAVITGVGINLADNTEVLRDGLPGDAWVSVGRPLPASVHLGEGA